MGSNASDQVQLPVGLTGLVGSLGTLLVLLELAPKELSTLSGRVPEMVRGNIPETLALLVCSLLVWSALVLVLRKDKRGIRYLMAGTMLSVFVGTVIMLVGTSWTIVKLLNGDTVTAELFLGSGTLSGALLALIALGTLKRAHSNLDDLRPGGRP